MRKSDHPSGAFNRQHLISGLMPLWQPRVGARVKVVRGNHPHDTRFIGKIGNVERNQGFGLFRIKFDDGSYGNVKSRQLDEIKDQNDSETA